MHCPIKWDLARVMERMSSFYIIKAGDIRDYAHLEKHIERDICPALVLYSARIYGEISDKVSSLAQIFQFIFLSLVIHQDTNEDRQIKESCTDPRDGCQYPVLVGDYLCGRFFTTLCEADIIEYLDPLSEIICMINEGSILRLKSQRGEKVAPGCREEIIRLEKAEMLAGCCRLGGHLAGADRESQNYLHRFGFALGMGLGMSRIEMFDRAEVYFKEALSFLDCLKPGNGREDLRGLLVFLRAKIKDSQRMVC
ncbi:MAG: polyprenyl synthetase family protein [Desulfocucumaceae bacterium]